MYRRVFLECANGTAKVLLLLAWVALLFHRGHSTLVLSAGSRVCVVVLLVVIVGRRSPMV